MKPLLHHTTLNTALSIKVWSFWWWVKRDSTLYSVRFTLHIIHCTAHLTSLHWKVYIVQSAHSTQRSYGCDGKPRLSDPGIHVLVNNSYNIGPRQVLLNISRGQIESWQQWRGKSQSRVIHTFIVYILQTWCSRGSSRNSLVTKEV